MEFLEAIKAAGVVGAGGAGFPTHVKLQAEAECFIVNAAECEPLIETDKYLCRTQAVSLVRAVAAVADHLGAGRRVIALKESYSREIEALLAAVKETGAEVEIFTMTPFYPAGDEQTIVQEVMGRSVPERGLPLAVGAVVDNVGTVLNIADALAGKPVTEKILSVVGDVNQNILVQAPLGTPIAKCIEAAGARPGRYAVIQGGPMMGKLLTGSAIDEAVVTKTTGNLIVLPEDHYLVRWQEVPIERAKTRAKSSCIQCRMCTDLCPRYLLGHRIRPHLVMRNLWRESGIEDAEEYERAFGDAANCCDCGACEMFSCPMGLSPKRVNGYIKERLRSQGIDPEKNQAPEAREELGWRRIPTGRLVRRLGLGPYYKKPLKEPCVQLEAEAVRIPLKQHIGAPAELLVQVGERVEAGQLIAAAAEKGISAAVHASITGVVTSADESAVNIRRE